MPTIPSHTNPVTAEVAFRFLRLQLHNQLEQPPPVDYTGHLLPQMRQLGQIDIALGRAGGEVRLRARVIGQAQRRDMRSRCDHIPIRITKV
jgi:hypothetical protein